MTQAFRAGLRARLVGAVLLLLVGLLATVATLVVVRSEQALEEIDELRAQAATDQLAESAATGVLARSALLLEAPIEAFVRTPELIEVRVLDEQGNTLIERQATQPTMTPLDDRFTRRAPVRLEPAVPALEGGLDAALDPLADPLFDPLAEPLAAPGTPAPNKASGPRTADAGAAQGDGGPSGEGEVIGEVVATFGRTATARVQRRTRNDMVIAFVGLGALGLLLVLLVATSVVRRVRTLADAAAQVAGGDLDTRVDDEGRDELADLSQCFNQMAAALSAQRARLQDAADELAASESLAAIGRATAVIAHELKNPLGILLGAADIAKDDGRPEAQRQKAAAIISDEVKRLDATLKQLLGYARPRAPERTAVRVAVLLHTAAQRAALPGGPAASIDVQLDDRTAALARAGEGPSALVDEPQLAQVLLNLVTNAAQAGASRVELSLVSPSPRGVPGGRLQLVVDDNGPGVDEAVAGRLFQPFVTTKQRGAGLGLAGSRRLCRDNGGDLRYDGPSPLGGARFVIALSPAPDAQPTRPVAAATPEDDA